MKKSLFFAMVYALLSVNLLYSQPSNDDCSAPIVLTNLSNWCSANGAYTNVGSTATISSLPTCWTGTTPNNDVWFKFTAVAAAINISVDGSNGGGTLVKPQIAVYAGTCSPFSMTEKGCTQFTTTNTGYASLYLSGLTIGQVYYIVIDGYNSNTGTFKLCVNNFDPPTAPGQDCATGAFLCDMSTITQQSLYGAGTYEAYGTCLDGSEKNSVWFKWVCATAGNITFSINPLIPDDDIDWVFYELIGGSCNNKDDLRCNSSSCVGATGLKVGSSNISVDAGCNGIANELWCSPVNLVVGKTYGLLINNWTDASVGLDNGFTLSFGGTGTFVGPVSAFTFTPAGPYCPGQNIEFTNTSTGGATSYSWSFGADASIVSANTVGPHTVSYSTTGIKTIVLTVGNGSCTDVSYQTIEISDCCVPPNITVQPQDVVICDQTSHTFTVTASGVGPLTYQWQFNGVDIPGANGASYTISPITTTSAGSYNCIVSDGQCDSISNIAVLSFGATSLVDFSAEPLEGCEPLTVHFVDLSDGTATSWNWNFGDPSSGSNISVVQNPTHTFNHAGSYTITLSVTSNQGCISTLSIPNMIVANESPVVNFFCSPSSVYEDAPVVSFINNTSGATIYLWDFNDLGSPETSNEVNPVHVFSGTGTYQVWQYAENAGGCRDSSFCTVNVLPLFTIFVPDAFSPNGDGINDFFAPYGAGWDLSAYTMIVYDRWGKVVFRTTDVNQAWDGHVAGTIKNTSQNVFSYVLEVKEVSGIEHRYYGRVLLLY